MKRTKVLTGIVLGTLASMAIAVAAHAGMARHWVATQYDWDSKKGFYVDFENDSPNDEPAPMGKLRVCLGVADGKAWRFIVPAYVFEAGKEYTVKAVIGPKGSELFVDGKSLGRIAGGYALPDHPVSVNGVPDYAKGARVFGVVQKSTTITAGNSRYESTSTEDEYDPLAPPIEAEGFEPAEGDTITIESLIKITTVD